MIHSIVLCSAEEKKHIHLDIDINYLYVWLYLWCKGSLQDASVMDNMAISFAAQREGVASVEQQSEAAHNPQITVEQLDLELQNKWFCQKKRHGAQKTQAGGQFLDSVHGWLTNISSKNVLI